MVDRQLLASFSNYIVPDLSLTNTEFGLLTGLVFLFFYSIMGLVMGMLADTVNRTKLIAIGLALWSGFTALSGMARGFMSLAIPRVFVGIGESIMTPSAMSLLADRFPSSHLGFAAGFYYLGVPIGAGVSLLIAGYLGPVIGWRNSFYLLGAIGLILATLTWFLKDTPRKYVVNQTDKDMKTTLTISEVARITAKSIPRSSALLFTIAGAIAMSFYFGTVIFDQLWLVEERGFERGEIARFAGWLALVGGVFGNLTGGVGSDWLYRKTGLGRPMFLFWVLLLLSPITLGYRFVPGDSVWIFIGIFFGMFQVGAFYGPAFSTVQELVPAQIRSTIVAFLLLMMNLVGTGLGVTLAGIAIDSMTASGIAEPYTLTLIGLTFFVFFAIPCFFIAGLRFEKDRIRVEQS